MGSWMRHPIHALLAVLATVVLALPTACSGPGDHDDVRGGSRSTQVDGAGLAGNPDAPPALAFDPKPAHVIPIGPLEKPPVTLYGRAVWIADEAGLTVVDVRTGKTVSRVEPKNPPLYDAATPEDIENAGEDLIYPVLPPQVGEVDGKRVVLATVPVRLPAKNAGEPQNGIEVIVVGADDGKPMWRIPVDVYGEPDGHLGAAVWRPPHDGMAAVQWTVDGLLTGTFVVDLEERRVLWQRTDFMVVDGYADALVGFRHEGNDYYAVAGVNLADGTDLWSLPPLERETSVGGRYEDGYAAGPWTLLSSEGEPQLIEIATGRTALSEQSGLKPGMSCRMRHGGTAVLCASDADGALALSIKTGEVLWQKPRGEGPDGWTGTVSTTVRDRAYVDRADGPVVIDIRSGTVVGPNPGIAPDRANAYAGLVFTGTDVEIHLPRGAHGAVS